MENAPEHEIELYPPESFKILMDHEVNRSRRYEDPLTLLHLAFETDPTNAQTQHSTQVFAINVLHLRLRKTDISCQNNHEFLVLMPSTDELGGRAACERLEKLFKVAPQTYDRVSFKLNAFIGMATLPGDSFISSQKLLQNASQALKQARANGFTNTVIFSEIQN